MEALGLIETRGLLSSIVAADAAVKAANVRLLNAEIIKGGLVTVQLLGDVAAVQAAVEAGENAITSFQTLISVHVIPRMHHETGSLLKKLPQKGTVPAKLEVEIQPSLDVENKPSIDTSPDYPVPSWEQEKLEKMTVLQLRQLARANDITLLDKTKNIKYARKSELIQAILAKDNNEKKEK